MKKRHTPEQIVRMLRQADAELAAGASAPEVAKTLGISDATFHRWRNLYGGMKVGAMKRATHLNHVWSYAFVVNLTEDGRRLKMMPVVDEYSRECLSIEVERSITAEEVVSTLTYLFCRRGKPAFIRSDNGPEFIARAIKQWLEISGVRTLHIEAGSPWESAYSETFISRFSDELL